jgi:pyruvate dehydrogenase E2 component (dihydrolipoamide acetyltransferase)
MHEVVMPRLAESMEEGTLLRWLKADGDDVRAGEELAEIESDKATVTYESEADGVLHIVAAEGDTVAVGTPIALLLTAGEQPPDATSSNGGGPAVAAPVAPPAVHRVKASPLARRLAADLGVDVATVAGSGPGGRVVRADVEAARRVPEPEPEPALAPAAASADSAKGTVSVVEMTRTQQVVARRMAEAKATVPEFQVSTEVDMEACRALRADLKSYELDVVPSFNDMVVKASAIALREFPRANASYRDGGFELYSRVNVGVAVAAEDSLLVPTLFDADRKRLTEIAGEARALAAKVREGSVTPPELAGGTFTVSNLGMHGVTTFNAVINPPQAAILAVGAIAPAPVVHDGEIVVRHRMSLTLTCDHRILYGAEAAGFLARIRALLEQPLRLR